MTIYAHDRDTQWIIASGTEQVKVVLPCSPGIPDGFVTIDFGHPGTQPRDVRLIAKDGNLCSEPFSVPAPPFARTHRLTIAHLSDRSITSIPLDELRTSTHALYFFSRSAFILSEALLLLVVLGSLLVFWFALSTLVRTGPLFWLLSGGGGLVAFGAWLRIFHGVLTRKQQVPLWGVGCGVSRTATAIAIALAAEVGLGYAVARHSVTLHNESVNPLHLRPELGDPVDLTRVVTLFVPGVADEIDRMRRGEAPATGSFPAIEGLLGQVDRGREVCMAPQDPSVADRHGLTLQAGVLRACRIARHAAQAHFPSLPPVLSVMPAALAIGCVERPIPGAPPPVGTSIGLVYACRAAPDQDSLSAACPFLGNDCEPPEQLEYQPEGLQGLSFRLPPDRVAAPRTLELAVTPAKDGDHPFESGASRIELSRQGDTTEALGTTLDVFRAIKSPLATPLAWSTGLQVKVLPTSGPGDSGSCVWKNRELAELRLGELPLTNWHGSHFNLELRWRDNLISRWTHEDPGVAAAWLCQLDAGPPELLKVTMRTTDPSTALAIPKNAAPKNVVFARATADGREVEVGRSACPTPGSQGLLLTPLKLDARHENAIVFTAEGQQLWTPTNTKYGEPRPGAWVCLGASETSIKIFVRSANQRDQAGTLTTTSGLATTAAAITPQTRPHVICILGLTGEVTKSTKKIARTGLQPVIGEERPPGCDEFYVKE